MAWMWAWWLPLAQAWLIIQRLPRGGSERLPLSRELPNPAAAGWSGISAFPSARTVPIGVGATHAFPGGTARPCLAWSLRQQMRAIDAHACPGTPNPWIRLISRVNACLSFGDGTHALAAAQHLPAKSWVSTVVGLGTYSREMARAVSVLPRSNPGPGSTDHAMTIWQVEAAMAESGA